MINFIKQYILNLLYSDRCLSNYQYTQFRIFLLNKISPEKLGVFKIKNFLSLPPDKRILKGYSYTSKTQNSNNISVPDLNLYIFKKAIINSRSSAIVVNSTVYYESINDNERFNEGFVKINNTRNAIVKIGKPEVISDGFFLAGNGSHNWYHWIIEILPKMLYYNKAFAQNILVSQTCKDIPSMAKTLHALAENFGINIIYLNAEKTYQVNNLYFINEVNKLMFNALNDKTITFPLYYYRMETLENFSNTLKDKFLKEVSPHPKIFLERINTHRVAKNEKEISRILTEQQFVTIDLTTLSINKQVETFYNAKTIVGTTGAAMTNILFCQPQTNIIIFAPRNYSDYRFFQEIADVLQLDLNYIYYENGTNNHEESDFVIDKLELQELLKKYN